MPDNLAAVQAGAREETVRPGHVPATTLCALRPADGRVVGFANVRHRLNRGLACDEVRPHLWELREGLRRGPDVDDVDPWDP